MPLRSSLRGWLCERIRRCFAATKQLRRSLTDDVIRLLTSETTLALPVLS